MQDKKIIYKFLFAIAVVIISIIFLPTISEFIVALYNRYRVYPEGTDTDMYGNTIIVQVVLLAGIMMLLSKYFLKFSRVVTFVLAPFIAILIVVLIGGGVASMIPNSWCKYELKIYSCEEIQRKKEYIRYFIN